jgi:hypothetical protein
MYKCVYVPAAGCIIPAAYQKWDLFRRTQQQWLLNVPHPAAEASRRPDPAGRPVARPELSISIGFSPTLRAAVGFCRPTSTNSFVIIIHISSSFIITTVHPFIETFLVSFVFNLS